MKKFSKSKVNYRKPERKTMSKQVRREGKTLVRKKLVRESMFDEVPNEEVPCRGRGCESTDTTMRYDNYGIPTGYYCDDCYENNYLYRKDAYFDPDYAGERLEDDY